MKKNELSIKQELSVEDSVNLFNEIAKSLGEGTIFIEYGEKNITLKPGCRIESVIEASQKKGKQKISIELSWKEEDPLCSCQPSLKISSQAPVVEEVLKEEIQESQETEEENMDNEEDTTEKDRAEEDLTQEDADKDSDTETTIESGFKY